MLAESPLEEAMAVADEAPASNGSLKRKAAAMDDETESEPEDGDVQLPDALRRSTAVAEGGHHEAGIILRVKVENFMCHRMFDVKMNSGKVVFITGQNGSGNIA